MSSRIIIQHVVENEEGVKMEAVEMETVKMEAVETEALTQGEAVKRKDLSPLVEKKHHPTS